MRRVAIIACALSCGCAAPAEAPGTEATSTDGSTSTPAGGDGDAGDTGSSSSSATGSSSGDESTTDGSESGAPPSCDVDDGAIEFFADVYPRLAQRGCTTRACHDADVSPSGAPADALAFYLDPSVPGGAPVVPGDPDGSPLLAYLQAYAAQTPTPITDDDVELVRRWIAADAPAGTGPSPSCTDAPALSYADVVAPIFAAGGCAGSSQCHAPGGVYPEMTWDALVDQPAIHPDGWTLVVPGAPDESSLVWHLVDRAQPNGLVDGPEIALVSAWVRDGAAP